MSFLPSYRAALASPEADAAILARLAEDGNEGAQVQVAIHLLEGTGGFPKDSRQAVRWFERAAIQGNAYAQWRLGELYARGQGVARNPSVAADWLEKAAHRGMTAAQLELAGLYMRGEGVEKAPLRREYWLERASIEGNAEARTQLAALRHERALEQHEADRSGNALTRTRPQTYEEALRVVQLLDYAEFRIDEVWHHRLPELEKLADDGDPQAQFVIGTYYLQGAYGKPHDVARALNWYRRAADGGSRRAALALARLYGQGTEGLAMNPQQAKVWAARAESLSR